MYEKLNKYKQKRNFEKTLEPKGTSKASKDNLQFVVQHHIARREHYDFRLEWDGVLLSWAVPKGPSYDTHDKRLAVKVEDHPFDYRNFEGFIPKGEYGGGVVMLWDEGIWEPVGDVDEGLRKGELKFILKGKRLKGKWTLIKWKAKSSDTKDNWLLLKEKDEYVQTEDGISGFTTSIRTGRTMSEIESGEAEKIIKNPFNQASVQLAKLVNEIPEGDEWLYELKYDGYRIIAYVEGNNVRLLTRNGNDYYNRFYNIGSSLMELAGGRAMVLDGEIAITDESGKTDFQALQNYVKNPSGKNPTYIIFDLLALDGVDLRERQLIVRKNTLEALLKDAPSNLYYGNFVKGNGRTSFDVACEGNFEGIVGKKANSIYSGTRDGSWIKLKCNNRQEFVIGGYTLTDKRATGVSALLLGVYEGDELVYVGRAGTGLNQSDMIMFEQKFKDIKSSKCFFKVPPEQRSNEVITWLEPELVAEIKFAEWTKDNLLRQASYKGLRIDKNPKDVRRENDLIIPREETEMPKTVDTKNLLIEGVLISSPNKILYESPEYTKVDVVMYYDKIWQRMAPHISNRVLSVVRCPKGISKNCFFLKHPGSTNKEIIKIPITNSKEETVDYFYINSKSGLIYEAQMGTLEFHTWGSTVSQIDKPDMMVFDLDPDEGMELERVRQGVLDLRSILVELSLKSYLKTSGGKGYHVVVPLKPNVNWDVFHDFAKTVAEVMEQKWPDCYTSNIRKEKRKDKIFIDWIRNGRGATGIAPYSIRAREGAKVSMPIHWDELQKIPPDGIDMQLAIARSKQEDPWKDFFDIDQMLK